MLCSINSVKNVMHKDWMITPLF